LVQKLEVDIMTPFLRGMHGEFVHKAILPFLDLCLFSSSCDNCFRGWYRTWKYGS